MSSLVRPLAPRQRDIAAQLLAEIRAGVYPPGALLPTREELQKRFAASNTTIQRALDQLIHHGFVEARRGGGSTITRTPPHLCRFGLVFSGPPTDAGRWTRFAQAISDCAAALEQSGRLRFARFHGPYTGGLGPAGAPLAAEVAAGCLAGLIFVRNPDNLIDLLPSLAGIPMVALVRKSHRSVIPRVYLDRDALLDRALDHLVARRRRRIAILTRLHGALDIQPRLLAGLAARRLTFHSHWLQEASETSTWAGRSLVHLLLRGRGADRPDGLLITDDNLVPAACEGLVAAGVRIPGELDVVAHCNWPQPPAHAVPVHLLGFDVRQVVATCLDVLRRQSQGRAVPPLTAILPCSEAELDPEPAMP